MTVALTAHAAFAYGFLASTEEPSSGESAGGFVIELAAVPVARADVPENVAPGPDQVEAASAPDLASAKEQEQQPKEQSADPTPELPEPPPVQPSDLTLPAPEAKQAEAAQQPMQPQAPAPTTSATQTIATEVAAVAKAPVQGPPRPSPSYSLPTWKSKIETSLEKSKRYPASAQSRGQHGVAHVSFVINREGRLLSSRLERGTGHPALDEEALELLKRAEPFPPPPGELGGLHVSLSVPIRFNLR
ncbi:MAG: energy transducer TonB [Hyphomicrobium sp.]